MNGLMVATPSASAGGVFSSALLTPQRNKKAAQRNCGPRFLPLTAVGRQDRPESLCLRLCDRTVVILPKQGRPGSQ